MENFTMAELGVFIGVIGGVTTTLILTIQKSRCETISCCGMKCVRNLPAVEKKKTQGPETPVPSPVPSPAGTPRDEGEIVPLA
jgi:hypothetical protein